MTKRKSRKRDEASQINTLTYFIRADRGIIANSAWARLAEIVDNDLSNAIPEKQCIYEAELMLHLLRAVSERADHIYISLAPTTVPGSPAVHSPSNEEVVVP